jgi:RNA polymerase sigma factor (sigma-70 family)
MLSASFHWPSAEKLAVLVRDAHAGRAHAVDELLTILRPALLAFFQQRQPADTAEDLTQLALIRISGAISRIDPERADSYISTVARNLLRTAYRVRARDRTRESDTDTCELPAVVMDAESRAEFADLLLAVHRACLTKLSPGLREVAVGLLQGETAADIADSLHISPVTVRTRLMRVRAVLRHELASYLESREVVHQ